MSTDIIPFTIVSPLFNDASANIALRSRATSQNGIHSPGMVTLFRVDSARLAANSIVFRDMCSFDPPEPDCSATVPELQLEESADDLASFLPFFYDDTSRYPDLSRIAVEELVKLWEIADKYQAPLITYMAANEAKHRVAQPETCDAVSALRVYVLAIKLGERSIAAAALICTFQGKYSAFPTHLVESLPPKALNTLARLHFQKLDERYTEMELQNRQSWD